MRDKKWRRRQGDYPGLPPLQVPSSVMPRAFPALIREYKRNLRYQLCSLPQYVERSSQRVDLCCHDKVVAVETPDFVSPQGNRDAAPFGQNGRMMSFLLGQSATRFVKANASAKFAKRNARSSLRMLSRSFRVHSAIWGFSSRISASVTRGESRRQAVHFSLVSSLMNSHP